MWQAESLFDWPGVEYKTWAGKSIIFNILQQRFSVNEFLKLQARLYSCDPFIMKTYYTYTLVLHLHNFKWVDISIT